MKQYEVTGSVITLSDGIVELTPMQYAKRMHALKAEKKKGVFRIISPVQFKHGEVLGIEGDINKITLKELTKAEKDTNGNGSLSETTGK